MVAKIKTSNQSLNLEAEKFLLSQKIQQQKYNISDKDVEDIKSKLPDKKYYEFAYHMFYQNIYSDLEQVWNRWKPWDIWDYPVYDLHRFNIIFLQNKEFFANKNIVDLGCNLGYFSLFSLHCGSKHVKGIDARANKLKIAKFICSKAGYDNFDFVENNINNYDSLQKILQNIDTILFSGLIYHIPNHYQVLSELTKSKASCIIIDNYEMRQYTDSQEPHIHWKYDYVDGDNKMSGFEKNKDKILVGKPNQTWIDSAMTELGWKIQKIQYYESSTGETSGPRVCSVFTR